MVKQNDDINKNIKGKRDDRSTDEDKYLYLNDDFLLLPKLTYTHASLATAFTALLCFWQTQYAQFTFDDNTAILSNKDIQTSSPLTNIFYNDFWGTYIKSKASHKSYRPLTVLTFRLNYFLANGYHPWGFHFVNVCLHAVNSVLLLSIFPKIFSNRFDSDLFNAPKASLLCAVLFAVHPIHTESVAAAVGRADLLCTMFFIISFSCFMKCCSQGELTEWKSLIVSLASAFISMFCKEQGITVLGLCVAYDVIMMYQFNLAKVKRLFNGEKNSKELPEVAKRTGIVLIAAVLFLTFRMQIMGSQPPQFQYHDNPASFQETLMLRVINYIYVYSLNIWLLLVPWWLCFDWAMGCVPVITSYTDPRITFPVLLVLIFVLVFLKLLLNLDKFYARVAALSVAILVIPFLPAMNIFFRVGFVIAERNLYISSIGFVMIVVVGLLLFGTNNNFRTVVNAVVILIVPLFIARSIHRSYDWMNEEALFNSGANVCPLNAKVHYNIGKVNQDIGNIDAAIENYLEAIRLHSEYDQPMNNIGNIYKDKGMITEAEYHLEKAVQISPNFAAGWMNLGSVKTELKKKEEGIRCYREAVTHRRRYPDAYFNWGNLHLQYKEYDEALEKFKMAVEQKPDHQQAWQNAILMLGEAGRTAEMKQVAKDAVKVFPTDDKLHLEIGNAFGKAEALKEAESYLKKSIELNPGSSNAYGNLGVLYHRLNQHEEAQKNYRKCLELDPSNVFMRENYKKLQTVLARKRN